MGWGVGRESGLLDAALDRLPGAPRPLLRGVLAGLLTALALCTAVVAVALAADAARLRGRSPARSAAPAPARSACSASACCCCPTPPPPCSGWPPGPGFFVGAGTLVSVHGVTLGAVPALPLLAALPDTQAVPLIAFVSQAVPALAGLVAGRHGRPLVRRRGRRVGRGRADRAASPGSLLGVVSGVLVLVAGGSLGDGALAEVGAPAAGHRASRWPRRAGIAAALAATVARWRSLG